MRPRMKLVLPPPRLLTVDAFGTIYSPRPSVPDQYSQKYSQHFPTHRPLPPARISNSFRQAFKARAQSHPNYFGGEKEWWTDVIRATFTIAAADAFTEISAAQVSSLAREVFVNDLYEHFNSGQAYMLMPDITGFLDSIHRVTRVGILSNSDSRCRVVLRELGVLASADDLTIVQRTVGDQDGRSGHGWVKRDQDVVLSCEVGVEKPDVRMFEAAVEKLLGSAAVTESVSPEDEPFAVAKSVRYWHVGDDVEKDVLPLVESSNALKLRGWGAVYLKRSGDDGVSNAGGDVRLTHGGRVIEVTDLRDLIGLWDDGVGVIVE
ncbi:hypothetical protein V1520DRAFT_355066 [Lipomyces starkeyi]|uniref:Haloacid dehalogenase-like hydrolase n=1 Tax=Lipomyces starkeyi NRRL Y-11557 TaxID=675824 RepID=A0A1E3Q3H0_LIPST|nr:hypothetical protein LIPSTDRAFT_4573 [Lipomyces starkeyi NRRL Y-11557]